MFSEAFSKLAGGVLLVKKSVHKGMFTNTLFATVSHRGRKAAVMTLSIRVVFFDAANTLFHVNGSVAEIYLHHAAQFGFAQTPQSLTAIKLAFNRAFSLTPSPPVFAATDPLQMKQSERLWWFDVVHNVFYRVGMFERFDEFFDRVFQVFEDAASWRLYPETAATLTQLKDRGIELGIISNFDSRLFSVMRGLDIVQAFDTVTISSLAHAAKPARRIFQLALDKHAVDPHEALHVGDSVRDDVGGARKAGLHACLLDRDGTRGETDSRDSHTRSDPALARSLTPVTARSLGSSLKEQVDVGDCGVWSRLISANAPACFATEAKPAAGYTTPDVPSINRT